MTTATATRPKTTKERILEVLQPGVVLTTSDLARAVGDDQRVVYSSARNLMLDGVLQKSGQKRKGGAAIGATAVKWRGKPE